MSGSAPEVVDAGGLEPVPTVSVSGSRERSTREPKLARALRRQWVAWSTWGSRSSAARGRALLILTVYLVLLAVSRG